MSERRHYIDWLRVIAIFLLLIYHIAIVFQPWGAYIGFIQSEDTSLALWIPMGLINIWRIPLLFFVSGMGVCFAMKRRDWKQLLLDRGKRILMPLLFGSFLIVPVHIYLFQKYYAQETSYTASMGHLWFLANICIYVLQTIGFAFLDQKYDYKFFNFLRRVLKRPYFLYLAIIPFIVEAELTNPKYYATFVGNSHGFMIGMVAFLTGFLFVAIGESFWNALDKIKIPSLVIASGLYLVRLFFYELNGPHYLSAIEAINWIFAAFGFGYRFLNKPSNVLSYLSQSVYPVYILHMIFLYLAAYFILPLKLPIELSFVLIVLSTFAGCYVTYELLIRRINIIRPLFGVKRIEAGQEI